MPLTHTSLIYGRGYRAGVLAGISMQQRQQPHLNDLHDLKKMLQEVQLYWVESDSKKFHLEGITKDIAKAEAHVVPNEQEDPAFFDDLASEAARRFQDAQVNNGEADYLVKDYD